jgi:hypothetical protein
MGRTRAAENTLKKSLIISEKVSGRDDPDALPALHNLALLYVNENRLDDAEVMCQRQREIVQKHPQFDVSERELTVEALVAKVNSNKSQRSGEISSGPQPPRR